MIVNRKYVRVVSYSISTSNHNTGMDNMPPDYVVSYSISTSNHNYLCGTEREIMLCLILFLHQTTTIPWLHVVQPCCVLFYFYIKPQRLGVNNIGVGVVSYSISTSNHNRISWRPTKALVVSYSISTSNHNFITVLLPRFDVVSYSISTSNHNLCHSATLCHSVVSYSISTSNHNESGRVILLLFVVSYSISTSNHN